VDRAYSNWVHLRADGLEPEADFLAAVGKEEERIAAGWAPFWHYRGLSRYGAQLRDLLRHVPSEQVFLLRYRELVDSPRATLDRVSTFLGVAPGVAHTVAPENVKPYVPDTRHYRLLSPLVRAGARLGAALPPQVWRQLSRPLVAGLHSRNSSRPHLSVEARREVLEPLLEDIALLEELTGCSFADWKGDTGRGSFAARTGGAASPSRPPDPVPEPRAPWTGPAPGPGAHAVRTERPRRRWRARRRRCPPTRAGPGAGAAAGCRPARRARGARS
jgi:hypothetical protein